MVRVVSVRAVKTNTHATIQTKYVFVILVGALMNHTRAEEFFCEKNLKPARNNRWWWTHTNLINIPKKSNKHNYQSTKLKKIQRKLCVYTYSPCWIVDDWLMDIGGSWVSVRDSKESSTDIHTTSKMWPVSCDCENERVLSVSAPSSYSLFIYLFFFLAVR